MSTFVPASVAHIARPGLPRLVAQTLVAGAVGLIAWELWIRYGAPVTTGTFPLNGPIGLAMGALNALFGVAAYKDDNLLLGLLSGRQIAETVHYVTALIGYPLGYILFARPIAGALAPRPPWAIIGLAYGAGPFVFAGYVVWTMLLGNAPFFGWSGVAFGSLIGHMLLGLGVAAGAQLFHRR